MPSSIQRVIAWDDNANKPLGSSSTGTDNIATGQVAVGTSATQVVPARAGRRSVTLTPTSSVAYYVGPVGVTASTGLYVAAGGAVTIATAGSVSALGAAGFTLSYIENF